MGLDTSDGLRRTRDGLISDMTYAQWEASKQGYSGKQLSPISHGGAKKSAKDVTKKYIDSAKPRMGKVRYENGYRIKGHKTEIEVANHAEQIVKFKTAQPVCEGAMLRKKK